METEVLERHLKKTTILSNLIALGIALLVGLGTGYAFYYNTTSTLSIHTQQIQEIKTDVTTITDAINNTAVFQGVSKEQIISLEKQVNDVKQSQVRIETMLSTMASELIKQNKK